MKRVFNMCLSRFSFHPSVRCAMKGDCGGIGGNFGDEMGGGNILIIMGDYY